MRGRGRTRANGCGRWRQQRGARGRCCRRWRRPPFGSPGRLHVALAEAGGTPPGVAMLMTAGSQVAL
eukprot:6191431-Pleurochrysis_carterae.AAC.1